MNKYICWNCLSKMYSVTHILSIWDEMCFKLEDVKCCSHAVRHAIRYPETTCKKHVPQHYSLAVGHRMRCIRSIWTKTAVSLTGCFIV